MQLAEDEAGYVFLALRQHRVIERMSNCIDFVEQVRVTKLLLHIGARIPISLDIDN